MVSIHTLQRMVFLTAALEIIGGSLGNGPISMRNFLFHALDLVCTKCDVVLCVIEYAIGIMHLA